ncbi:hypothetical protein CQ043_00005, partial [Paenibacillus sp. MYb63]|uniref:hypothetical protein n=3 Tax=Paenibacillus TaxID=44249 RepID=UPI000D445062
DYYLIYSKNINVNKTGSTLTKMFELGSNKAFIHLHDRGAIISGANPTTDITTNIALTTTDPDGTERHVFSPSKLVTRLNNGTSFATSSRRYVVSMYIDIVSKVVTYYWSDSTANNYEYSAEAISSGLTYKSLNLSLYSVTNALGQGGYSEFSASQIVVSRLK